MNKRLIFFILLILLLIFVPLPGYTSEGWFWRKSAFMQATNVGVLNKDSKIIENGRTLSDACSTKIDSVLTDASKDGSLNKNATIFVRTKVPLSQAQLAELSEVGVTINKESWTAPVNDFPTGYYLATVELQSLAKLCDIDYVVRVNSAELEINPN